MKARLERGDDNTEQLLAELGVDDEIVVYCSDPGCVASQFAYHELGRARFSKHSPPVSPGEIVDRIGQQQGDGDGETDTDTDTDTD
ncbi:MAG: hypothetical protein OEV40_09810, partial [Acidimicrobiia bacterium]|nr:hypothetical protein [Acidimicrobiia bacterium]